MKAAKRLVSAVSAVALATAPAVGGAILVQTLSVQTAQAAVVNSLSVRGNQRVASATIGDFVGYRPGRNYSAGDLDDAVKRLFRTGLFSDVEVTTSAGALIVVVEEYSIVNQVLFQGNRKLKDDRLNQVVQLRPRSAFDQQTLNSDVEAVIDSYSRIGRNDVTVNAEVIDLGENRVNVIYRISEGGRTKISKINFIGNQAYGDRRLQGVISTKRSNFLSFLSSNDVYDEQRLAADEEELRRFYYNRGYADFRVLSSSGDEDPETGNIIINIEVDEGERYTFGQIDIDSTVSGVDAEDLRRRIVSRTGRVYSASDVEDTLIAISEVLAGQGFPFAEVTPVGDRNFDNRSIDVSYIIDQGQRAYVERIEIVGNTRTRDYVIRREFDIAEGDAFNQILIRRAQRRLQALDFFERVNVTTRPGSSSDRVVVVVEAIDKPTGEFGVGAGYSTGGENEGVNFEGSIVERNFLGRGQTVRLAIGGGEDSRTYNVSFTEPYFLGYRLAATFAVYRRTNEYSDEAYETATQGGSVSFGLPITDRLRGNVGYSYDEVTYDALDQSCDGILNGTEVTVDDGCTAIQAVQDRIGTSFVTSALNYGLTFNSIDNNNDPREGIYATVQQQLAGLGGDARHLRTTGDARYYHTISEDADLIGLVRLGAGNITGLSRDVDYSDHFRIGPTRIRGFSFNGIGPTDANGNQIGGKNYVNASLEAQFPLPAIPRDFGFKGAVFTDAATLFGSDVAGATNTDMSWRASAGVSIIWQSPFAPLRFDYAVPLVKEDFDDERNFNFSVSTAF